jgi:dipeptidyl aminopeptidase/acylaminoacyl peptidase
VSSFDLHYPVLCRIHPDGSGKQDMLAGLVKKGTLRTNYFMRQPTVDPSGAYVVLASDGPTVAADPSSQLMQLHYVTLSSKKMSKAIPVPVTAPYGLSEPEYAPDGGSIAYTMEGWSGGKGNPSVWIYSNRTRTARKLAMGFRGPAWSPDGKYIAATKVSGDSLNVYVLDSSAGQVVGKITSDGESFGAVWSPDGTRLIYMQMSGALAALNMVYISNEANGMAFRIEPNLVDLSGLDSGSTASWYMPGFGPQPTPTPVPSDTASPSAS